MKILQINSSDIGGGAERVAYQINRELNYINNIQSNLLVRNKKSTDKSVIELKRSNVDKAITRVYNEYLSTQGKIAIGSIKANKWIFKNKYDVIHLHNIHSNYYNFKNLNKIAQEKPIVWTLHDMWAFTGRCAYAYECIEWKNKCGRCKDLSTFPQMKIDNSSKVLRYKKESFVNQNIKIVTPSKWLENLVRQSFMKDMNITTIYNGVDINLYKHNDKKEMRNIYNLKNDKLYILLISANINDTRKGFGKLIEKLNKLEEKNKYGILIVGKELDKQLIDSQFYIKQFGYIKDESKLNKIYSLADVFIMPTLADNFPCTILEAMSSGTPVISYPIGGIQEQIDDEVGWVIDKDNEREFIDLFNNITKEKCIEKGIRARKRVEDKFSLDICIKKYIALYESIIN